MGQNRLDLVTRQYYRQPFWLAGSDDSLDPVQRLLRHVLKEPQRRQSLPWVDAPHVFLDGQIRQKRIDVAFAQFTRMRTGVKQSEAVSPVDVGLFSAAAVMPGSQAPPPGRKAWELAGPESTPTVSDALLLWSGS